MSSTPTFDQIWDRVSRQIRRGDGEVDTASGQLPTYTLIARLGSDIGALLEATARAMGIAAQRQYIYPPPDIHLTILYLTPYLFARGHEAAEVRYATTSTCHILDEVFCALRPLDFTVRGLNLFPTTVPAQLHSQGDTSLRAVRVALAGRLKAAGLDGPLVQTYERELYWDLAFANVVRFVTPPAADLVDQVAEQRETAFGNVRLSHLEFVRTDKVLSRRGTQLLRLLLLGQSVAGHEGSH